MSLKCQCDLYILRLLLLRELIHFLTWRGITSCSFECSLNSVAYILVISHACRQPCPAEKPSAPANFNNKIKISLMAGKNASWRNLVTRYEITTACPQARLHKARLCQGHSVGCFRHMYVVLNKGPSVRVLWADSGWVPRGTSLQPLARHHLPAALQPMPWQPEGLVQEVKHIPASERTKLKSTQPPEGNIYKHTWDTQMCGYVSPH